MNLPNVLTVLRLLMVPVFAYLYSHAQPGWALGIFLLAGATDALDGYLARKYDQITSFGKLMDPFADKVMTVTMLICLSISGRIARWVPIVLLVKEVWMVGASAVLLKKHMVVHANIFGKAATVLFLIAISAVYPWHDMEWLYRVGGVLIHIALAASLVAAVQYTALYARAVRKNIEV